MSIENNTIEINTGDISFDESKFKIRSRAILGAPEVPTMIRFLVGKRIAKNENQAVAILLSIVIVFLAVSVFFVNRSVRVQPAVINPALITH